MRSELKRNFGSRVRHFRKLRGLTQEQLAEMIDLQTNSLSYVENGKNSLSFDKFEKLVNVLKVEPYQFFLFDKRDDDNADLTAEIAKLAGTLDKNKASLAYKIIFEISSAVEQEK